MSQEDQQLVDVLEAHRFDEDKLAAYLREHLPQEFSGDFAIKQFQGGQSNPTFLLTCDGRRYVLRKKPPGKLLPSAHQVEREYQVMRALQNTDVPVPEMLLLCEDDSIIGTPFYVMRFIEGRVYSHPALEDVAPEERARIFEAKADTMARLHLVDYEAVGLADFGKPGNFLGRQIGRWTKQYEASRTGDNPSMEKLMEWLPANIPADSDETTIAHGDFRLGNLMLHPERPEVVAVLDWELCTLGHPLSDLAYCCIPYHLPSGLPGIRGLKDLDLKERQLPTEEEFVQMYCDKAGRTEGITDWPFYTAFALFRLAAILQGVYKRALDGNAANADALKVGEGATILADAGWQEAQRLQK
ncbi:phosphotransferase [Aquisalimonas sp. 2447]|uniref:phosphotransferase n=1 Tax=Aquisalimonas sp. 2447 TaxID=2740807 RepID=UPI001432605C|nr:phosphotransferase [Aquisalimonas sp. 2447]QIT56210.1 phosphotransferase [Aquisalimonas sp. 2447]